MLKKIDKLILISNEPKIAKYFFAGMFNKNMVDIDPMIPQYFYLGYLLNLKPDTVIDMDPDFLKCFFIGYLAQHLQDPTVLEYIFQGYIFAQNTIIF